MSGIEVVEYLEIENRRNLEKFIKGESERALVDLRYTQVSELVGLGLKLGTSLVSSSRRASLAQVGLKVRYFVNSGNILTIQRE